MPSEFPVRADSVDVEQIMGRIRARIREKRGVDDNEDEIRKLANVKIEGFLDPTRVDPELLEHYLKGRMAADPVAGPLPGSGGKPAEGIRRLLGPFRKLNAIRHAVREQRLNIVLIHSVVVELMRLASEVRNLKMQVESLSSRLDFNERRARALENVVQYRSGVGPGAEPTRATAAPESRREPAQTDPPAKGEAQRRRRRRRRVRGEAGGAPLLSSEIGSRDEAEPGPAATPPAPAPAAVPNRDTPEQ